MPLLLILLVTAGVSAGCVLTHWLVMEQLIKRLCSDRRKTSRVLLQGMAILLLTHLVHIAAFGVVFLLINANWPGTFGELTGAVEDPPRIDFLDAWYFSACTYSTVGYGDVSATGDLRILAGVEALVGFLMITWSASFSFYIMNHAWRDRFRD